MCIVGHAGPPARPSLAYSTTMQRDESQLQPLWDAAPSAACRLGRRLQRARAIVLLLTATIVACASSRDMTDLAGTYVFAIDVDTLRLDPTGRYTRVYGAHDASQRAAVDTGRWRVSNNGRMVSLAGLPRRWPEHGRFDPVSGRWHVPDTTARGTVALQIGVTWTGAVTLELQPEIGWRYRRVRR